MLSFVVEVDVSSEDIFSRRDARASSCFFWRAASSAATRSAMCSSRVLAREELVCEDYMSIGTREINQVVIG